MIVKDLLVVACSQQPTTLDGLKFVTSMRDQLLTELENAPTDFCWWGHGALGNTIDWNKVTWVEPTGPLNEFWKPND